MKLLHLAAAAAIALLAAGCVPDRMSLEPYGICSMPEKCTFSGKCETYHLGAIGYANAAGPYWLEAAVELRNQVQNNGDVNTGRANSNDAHVTGVELEIDGPATGNISQDVGNQQVPAGGTAVVWTYLLPPAAIQPLPSGTYTVTVRYVGYYDSGREFKTGDFPVGVEVTSAAVGYTCADPAKVITCGNFQQNLNACGAP